MEHQLNEIIEALLLSASRPVSIEEIEKVFVEIYPGARHELFNELNKSQVIHDLVKWMETKCKGPNYE